MGRTDGTHDADRGEPRDTAPEGVAQQSSSVSFAAEAEVAEDEGGLVLPEEAPGIVVAGVSGRMGQMLAHLVADSDAARLVGAVERPGHDWIGQDVGTAAGGAPLGMIVTDDPLEPMARAQALLDFTTPAATVALSELAAQARAVHVIGTTGLAPDDIARIDAAARHCAVVRAGNMSLGVNLLMQIVRQVAAALDDSFDIEIVEAHHRMKVDAPSGTALMLGAAAAEGRGVDLDAVSERGRDGVGAARQPGAIGFASLRGGDIVGTHDVIFAGLGETLTLRHEATDRRLFARGALRAALWGQGRPPGHYDMLDVLGLR